MEILIKDFLGKDKSYSQLENSNQFFKYQFVSILLHSQMYISLDLF